MASDLGLIMHTTESDTHIFSSESPCYRFSETGLTDSRRAIEAKDRRLHVSLELKHCQILDDSFLHLFKTVVILIQHCLRILQVKIVIGYLSPRKIKHELDVIVLYAVVRGARIVSLELRHLLLKDFLNGCRPELFLCTGTQLGEFFDIVHTKLLLNGLELVVEKILPLLLIYLGLDLLIDLLLDLLKFHLSLKHGEKFHCSCPQVTELKKIHLIHEVLHLYGRSNEIHKEFEVVYSLERSRGLTRNESRRLDDRRSLLLESLCNHPDLGVLLRHKIVQISHPSEKIRIVLNDILYLETLISLKNCSDGSVRHLKSLDYLGHGTITIQVFLPRILHRKVVLRNGTNEGIISFSVFNQPY